MARNPRGLLYAQQKQSAVHRAIDGRQIATELPHPPVPFAALDAGEIALGSGVSCASSLDGCLQTTGDRGVEDRDRARAGRDIEYIWRLRARLGEVIPSAGGCEGRRFLPFRDVIARLGAGESGTVDARL